MAIVVNVTGPLFNHTWEPILESGIRAAQEAVGEYGIGEIVNNLNDVIIENTGAYISTIHSQWETDDLVLTDGTAYGPWLEGLSSRNVTSRFKGYATFQVTTAQIQTKANGIAVTAMIPFIEKINL